jgi:hypothetical protein
LNYQLETRKKEREMRQQIGNKMTTTPKKEKKKTFKCVIHDLSIWEQQQQQV